MEVYYLGVDGGGTKTALLLTDHTLTSIRTLRCDCCNPVDIGMTTACDRLRAGITEICAGIPYAKISLFAGIAGGISAGNKETLAAFLDTFGFRAFDNGSDNASILAAGLGKANGISVILGTGICVFTQKDGVQSRTAGWGYLFDDGGSGYNIGRDGLTAHFRHVDGSGDATLLSDYIRADHPDPQELLGQLYAGGKKVIASYASLVYRAAKAGDPMAQGILRRNMDFAARMIQSASASLTEEQIPVVLTGGLTNEPMTLAYLKEALPSPSRYALRVLDVEPVWGAVLLAKEIWEQRK